MRIMMRLKWCLMWFNVEIIGIIFTYWYTHGTIIGYS
jgi:hypothetical protein